MKLNESKWVKITAYRKGKGEPFHWKPLQVPHRKSMADVQWTKGDEYLATHQFVTKRLQVFWLWFVIDFNFKMELLSSQKFIKYEATHFASIDDALK